MGTSPPSIKSKSIVTCLQAATLLVVIPINIIPSNQFLYSKSSHCHSSNSLMGSFTLTLDRDAESMEDYESKVRFFHAQTFPSMHARRCYTSRACESVSQARFGMG